MTCICNGIHLRVFDWCCPCPALLNVRTCSAGNVATLDMWGTCRCFHAESPIWSISHPHVHKHLTLWPCSLQIAQLFEDGDAVVPVPNVPDAFVLWRKSLLQPGMCVLWFTHLECAKGRVSFFSGAWFLLSCADSAVDASTVVILAQGSVGLCDLVRGLSFGWFSSCTAPL